MKRALGLAAAVVLLASGLGASGDCVRCNSSGTITCPKCQGQWRKVTETVPCKKVGRQGCDSSGYVTCFECRGETTKRCGTCGGDGVVRKRIGSRSTGGVMRRPVYERRSCSKCGGQGKCDCEKCEPLKHCPRCHGFFAINQYECPDCVPETHARGVALELLNGKVKCPRCKGTGMYERTDKCAYCERGELVCPECGGRKK